MQPIKHALSHDSDSFIIGLWPIFVFVGFLDGVPLKRSDVPTHDPPYMSPKQPQAGNEVETSSDLPPYLQPAVSFKFDLSECMYFLWS